MSELKKMMDEMKDLEIMHNELEKQKKSITSKLDLFEHNVLENLAAEFSTNKTKMAYNILIAGMKDAVVELGLDWEEMRLDYFNELAKKEEKNV